MRLVFAVVMLQAKLEAVVKSSPMRIMQSYFADECHFSPQTGIVQGDEGFSTNAAEARRRQEQRANHAAVCPSGAGNLLSIAMFVLTRACLVTALALNWRAVYVVALHQVPNGVDGQKFLQRRTLTTTPSTGEDAFAVELIAPRSNDFGIPTNFEVSLLGAKSRDARRIMNCNSHTCEFADCSHRSRIFASFLPE